MIRSGTTLGHYEFVSTLGRGGMGEVWRARDSTLGRDVAIKMLPAEYANDADRLSRLRREAKLLASLNHPNIATIHSLDDDNGVRFLVLELIEGATLEERIRQGAIPVDEALKIALQIADALETAHDSGIVHRDLKPANIKIGKNGHVKVLDFGLAKPLNGAERPPAGAETVAHETEHGRLLGTPGYMSPEQIRGEEIDARADIWAFGIILAEMLTGKPLLQGRTSADSLARALAPGEVELTLPAATPPFVARMIRRCLAKNPSERLRHIGDARIDLRDSIDGSFEVAPSARPKGFSRAWLGIAAAGLLVAGGAGAWLANARLGGNAAPEHYDITTPSDVVGANTGDTIMSIAADGTRVAYVTSESVYVYSLDSGESIPIARGFSPFFSPDGRAIGYFDNDILMRAPAGGGSATRLAEVRSRVRGGSWGESLLVFGTNDGLFSIPVDGAGEPRLLIAPDPERGELYFSWPEILPGERGVLFTILPEPGAAPEIAVLDLDTLTYERLITGGIGAQYATSGHLVYTSSGQIMAQPFNARTFRIEGDAVALDYRTLVGMPGLDVSATGTLAFAPPPPAPNVATVWVDPGNGGEVDAGLARPFLYARLSPDDSKVVGDNSFDGSRDLFIWDFERRVETRLTGDPREDLFAYFSPDGNSVYFTSNRLDNLMKVFVVPIDRSREPELVYGDDESQCWLMGVLSNRLLVMRTLPGGGREFLTVGLSAPRETELIVSLPQGGLNPVASPDERWLAYQSNETNRTEIWVRSLDPAAPAQVQISRAGGYYPQWSPDGRRIYYFAFDGALMAVDMNDESGLDPGAPYEALAYRYRPPVTGPVIADSGRLYDVARDGRLLMYKSTPAEARTIRVVRGFSSLLD